MSEHCPSCSAEVRFEQLEDRVVALEPGPVLPVVRVDTHMLLIASHEDGQERLMPLRDALDPVGIAPAVFRLHVCGENWAYIDVEELARKLGGALRDEEPESSKGLPERPAWLLRDGENVLVRTSTEGLEHLTGGYVVERVQPDGGLLLRREG